MTILFHYTNKSGYEGILQSKQLNPSTLMRNPKDVRYGDGQYLSDIKPHTKTPAQLSRLFLGQPFQGKKYTHYIEIDVRNLSVMQGRPHVFVIPNDESLDISERIITHGEVG
ncbi:MAG: HYD1 signature containing ADP-ribosyltransferase family protein [Chloroflexota bacterium]